VIANFLTLENLKKRIMKKKIVELNYEKKIYVEKNYEKKIYEDKNHYTNSINNVACLNPNYPINNPFNIFYLRKESYSKE
jgi:hypothetical protein